MDNHTASAVPFLTLWEISQRRQTHKQKCPGRKKTTKTEVHTDEVDQQLTIAVRSRAKHFCIPYILSQTLRGEELRSRASYVLCAQEGCILRFNLKNIRGCCLQEKSHTQGKPQAKKSESEVLVP